ncbi:MAG: RluA family pseudouridine synthase [Clostridia bacterium]|nr:RluA family pseudouridine synthase [Clostridia bacterium]
MAMNTIPVPSSMDGMRLDKCIQKLMPELPFKVLHESFLRRDVKLDGRRVKADVPVFAGQTIQVYYPDQSLDKLQIVYEDERVLLVNKKAGISVEDDHASLVTLAHRHVQTQHPEAPCPIPCHRLDNQTSGLILLAKDDAAASILEDVFRTRSLEKHYRCLVRGVMKPPSSVCYAYLKKNAELGRVQIFDREVPGARQIITEYTALSTDGQISRLDVHLITGRTHQIRAHMAALGHPLLGDDVYGDRALNRARHVQGSLKLCAVSLCLDTGGRLPDLDGKLFQIREPF